MDYLRSMIGMSKNNISKVPHIEPEQSGPATNDRGLIKPQQDVNMEDKTTIDRLEPVTALERLDLIGENVSDIMKQYIPLAEGDCLSCKLIGTSVFLGSGLVLLVSARRATREQTGIVRRVTIAGFISLACTMFILGSARLFDMSIFQKNTKKSILQMAQDDFKDLQEFFQNKPDGKR